MEQRRNLPTIYGFSELPQKIFSIFTLSVKFFMWRPQDHEQLNYWKFRLEQMQGA